MQKVEFTNTYGDTIFFGTEKPLILQRIEGAGNIDVNVQTHKAPYQDGVSYTRSNLQMRYLTLRVAIAARSSKELFEIREQISNVFNPKADLGTLTYFTPKGTKKIYAIPEETPSFVDYVANSCTALIYLQCPDPYWLDVEEESYFFRTPYTPTFQFPFVTFQEQKGLEMGYASENIKLTNKGHVHTPLYLEFYGGIKNTLLRNKTTNQFIKITKEINSSDKLIVNSNFGSKSIKLKKPNGTKENGFNLIDYDSDMFLELEKGENEIEFITESTVGDGVLFVRFNNKYLGQ